MTEIRKKEGKRKEKKKYIFSEKKGSKERAESRKIRMTDTIRGINVSQRGVQIGKDRDGLAHEQKARDLEVHRWPWGWRHGFRIAAKWWEAVAGLSTGPANPIRGPISPIELKSDATTGPTY